MSDRKLFGIFSGAQITAIVIAGIVTPGAVYAVATSAVTITDPATGHQSAVDASRRLYVYDPVAGLQNSPLNDKRVSGYCDSGTANPASYAPPSGYALIVKSADFTFWNGTSGADNYVYLSSTAGWIAGLDSPNTADFKNSDLGNGYYVRPGESITFSCVATAGFDSNFSVEGYLVPSNAVPPSVAGKSAVRPGGSGKRS